MATIIRKILYCTITCVLCTLRNVLCMMYKTLYIISNIVRWLNIPKIEYKDEERGARSKWRCFVFKLEGKWDTIPRPGFIDISFIPSFSPPDRYRRHWNSGRKLARLALSQSLSSNLFNFLRFLNYTSD